MIFVLLLIAFLHPAAVSTSHNMQPISVNYALNMVCLLLTICIYTAECYRQLWIIVYLFNVGSVLGLSHVLLTHASYTTTDHSANGARVLTC